MYIPILPPLTFPSGIFRSRSVFSFSGDVYWTSSGRAAIREILVSYKVPSGSEVLVPAYMCDDVIEAIGQMGYTVGYYNVPVSLECAVADIEPYITTRTKAILITHYFGFPQRKIVELVEFAHSHRLLVIEDCAHTLTSTYLGRPLGTFGDGSIFSPRKVVGIPYSGIVWTKDGKKSFGCWSDSCERNLIRVLFGFIIERFAMQVGIHPERIKRPLRIFLRKNNSECVSAASSELEYEWLHTVSIRHLKRLIPFIDLYGIHKRRVRNYNLLYDCAKESYLHPLFHWRPGTWCPYAFPIWIENGQEDFLKELWAAGIYAATWPRLPNEISCFNFPDAVKLRSCILLLPIHQEISRALMKKMCKIIKQISRNILTAVSRNDIIADFFKDCE